MICKYCNCENNDSAKFCQECGLSLLETNAENSSAPMKPKSKTLLFGFLISLLVVAFVVVFGFGLFGNSTENKLKGTWTRDSEGTTASELITYSFTSKGGQNTYSADNQNNLAEKSEFDWYVTDDDDLIILWSNTNCTRYVWNPNYENYKLSSNEYSWFIEKDRLYLSSNASEDGYYVYTK